MFLLFVVDVEVGVLVHQDPDEEAHHPEEHLEGSGAGSYLTYLESKTDELSKTDTSCDTALACDWSTGVSV